MSDKARLTAYNTVRRIFNGAFSNLVTLEGDLKGLDRAFAESIIFGTLERKITLEFILSKVLRKETKEDVKILLMTGIYQIFFMDKVPDNAACDETVEIAKSIFGKNTAGFVNGVLRNICREKDRFFKEIETSDEYIRYSVNNDLFHLIKEQYPEDYRGIFSAYFGKSPLFLRVNTLKSDTKNVSKLCNGEILGNTMVRCSDSPLAVSNLESGEFYIQGYCSQTAVEILGAKSGETVVDVCACPGGKTLGAAIDMENTGQIYSFDIHKNKLSLINKSAQKLGIDIIQTEKQDARTTKCELLEKADRVICDVPCSGTGVMGSKPEIKYKSPEDFKGLYPTQKAIIRAAAKYLKVGGTMVYSTWSINRLENEIVVNGFLSENSGFKLQYEKTFLPFEEGFEGFYVAKIIRET